MTTEDQSDTLTYGQASQVETLLGEASQVAELSEAEVIHGEASQPTTARLQTTQTTSLPLLTGVTRYTVSLDMMYDAGKDRISCIPQVLTSWPRQDQFYPVVVSTGRIYAKSFFASLNDNSISPVERETLKLTRQMRRVAGGHSASRMPFTFDQEAIAKTTTRLTVPLAEAMNSRLREFDRLLAEECAARSVNHGWYKGHFSIVFTRSTSCLQGVERRNLA